MNRLHEVVNIVLAREQTVSVYAHADSEAMEAALRSVDQEALPVRDSSGKIITLPQKKWRGKEEYLLNYSDLAELLSEISFDFSARIMLYQAIPD